MMVSDAQKHAAAPALRPGLSQKTKDRAATVALFMLTVGAWEFLTRALAVPSYVLPPPSDIAGALYRGMSSGLYLRHLWFTTYATLAGFAVGSLVGIALGAAIAGFRYAELLVYPYVIMFKSMPKVALAPLFALWFGLGVTSKIVSAAIICFFPLMVNTIAGLKSADEDRISLMKSMGASKLQIFVYLRLPSALPFIMAGLELAVVLALIGVIVAEFVGARAGLGTLIQNMNYNMDGPGQFSVLILLSAIGLTMNLIVRKLKKLVLFWDPSTQVEDTGTQI
jgi:NitT/TauT family transport system permease protein